MAQVGNFLYNIEVASLQEIKALRRITHITIRRVTDDIETRMQFNTAIAAIMELVNHLFSFKEWWKNNRDETARMAIREALEALVLTLSPFAPHIAEEMASEMRLTKVQCQWTWPQYNETLTHTDEMLIVLQVNGKVRQKIYVPSGISEDDLKVRSLEDPKIQEWIKGKSLDEASSIQNTDIVEELSLPPVKIHCSVLAEDAIKGAIKDYKMKNGIVE